MKEQDDNSQLNSADNAEVSYSEQSDYLNINRTNTIASICSKSGYNDSENMGEAIRRWESSRYEI